MTLNYTLEALSGALENILGPETSDLITRINHKAGSSSSPFVYLPDGSEHDPTTIVKLIARTSNEYAQICRLAGLARAQYKIAEAAYKFKFRTSLGAGKNAAERESKALAAAQAEYEKMILLEAIVELCESIESSTRIASESSRRMLLGADQYNKADGRAEKFQFMHDEATAPHESDFQTY